MPVLWCMNGRSVGNVQDGSCFPPPEDLMFWLVSVHTQLAAHSQAVSCLHLPSHCKSAE